MRTSAHGHGLRWARVFSPLIRETKTPFRAKSPCLIVNAFQRRGFALAEYLLERTEVDVHLVDRSFLPAPRQWRSWLKDKASDDVVSQNIFRIQALSSKREGFSAHALDPLKISTLRDQLMRESGAVIGGVFYLAPEITPTLITHLEPDHCAEMIERVIGEVQALDQCWPEAKHRFFFTSSRAENGIGATVRASVSAVLGHYAETMFRRDPDRLTMAIEWGASEMKDRSVEEFSGEMRRRQNEKLRRFGLAPEAEIDAFERVWRMPVARVIVSTRDYEALLTQQQSFNADFFRQASRERGEAGARPDLSTTYVAPRNDAERLLVDIWRDLFGIDRSGVHDNFFELGGHSLIAVQLLSKIEALLGVRLDMQDVFESPTIATLARLIDVEDSQDDLDDLLSEIEGLSPEQIHAALDDGDQSE